MKPFLIHDECWDADIWVLAPGDEPALVAFIKRKFGKDIDRDPQPHFFGRYFCVEEPDGTERAFVMALCFRKPRTTRQLATLVHECVHVAHAVLENRGVVINDETAEPLAYLTDSLFSRILNRLNK